jgi:hypothetical protein
VVGVDGRGLADEELVLEVLELERGEKFGVEICKDFR